MIKFVTRPGDRWDLIAKDVWQLPELAWAIAQENPLLAGILMLDGGIEINIPALESLRAPLTAANPARNQASGFAEVPGSASPLPTPTPTPSAIQFPIRIAQGGTEATTSQQALVNLGAIAIATKGISGGVAPLDATSLVPIANLPPFQAPLTFPISIGLGGTGANTAVAGLVALGGLPLAQKGVASGVAPLDATSLVPIANLPPFQAPLTFPISIGLGGTGANTAVAGLVALGGLPLAQKGVASGVAPLDVSTKLPVANLPINTNLIDVAQTITAGKTFSGGLYSTGTPPKLDATNTGLISTAFYFFFLSNTTNQKLSDLIKVANGNIQLRHLSDTYSTVLSLWEFTVSGNTLLPGALRTGVFTANPTAASNIPGGVYYNSTLKRLVMSDGTSWFQLAIGAAVP